MQIEQRETSPSTFKSGQQLDVEAIIQSLETALPDLRQLRRQMAELSQQLADVQNMEALISAQVEMEIAGLNLAVLDGQELTPEQVARVAVLEADATAGAA